MINRTWRQSEYSINSIHQFIDSLHPFFFTSQSTSSRTFDDWSIVTVKSIESQKFTNFHFNQFKQFRIVNHVNFVHEHNDLRNTYLASKKDVLTCLRHWTISSSYNKDSTVHLCSTSDHVLNIVSVTWTVNVCIVTVSRLILNVSSIDGDTTFFFFRSSINFIICFCFCQPLLCKNGCDCSS